MVAIKDSKVEAMMSQVDFKDPVLSEGHESLLKAFVRAHPNSKFSSSERDQRCSSLAILLHGPKITDKSLTVKALVSHVNRPLYTITCTDFARELANHFERHKMKLHYSKS
ncbi:5d41da2f-ad3a-40cd-85bf-4e3d8b0c02b4 [Sclerotinia trifoliorum]|uniref:5d41da2f-ad3a-40cd-85bf-4e3d8b0c02b4 n=1 Tax=Sclerotinia trifoliorum TaxID=28548 RepID=A0A8H2VL44_9HELO|nr:5d41da2f-ad3a-40cd-85bf-4e3d8b0c02b4 [Sclerotinia trifoliorum]